MGVILKAVSESIIEITLMLRSVQVKETVIKKQNATILRVVSV